MRKASWIMLLSLLACDDGAIGTEPCSGPACEAVGFALTELSVPFQDVPTASPSALPPSTWSIANPCSTPCGAKDVVQVFSASRGAAWNVVRASTLPTVELITGDGTKSVQQLDPPPSADALLDAYAVAKSDGTLLMHVLWSQPRTSQVIEEIAVFSRIAPVQRLQLRGRSQAARPLGAIEGGDGGYFLFDPDLASGKLTRTVRLLDGSGDQLWMRDNLPDVAPLVGGSAVWTSQHYVTAARNASDPSAYFMMWFDPAGALQRGTTISGSIWRNAKLYDRGHGRLVAVAQSDLQVLALAGANEGNIDIVSFYPDDEVTGFRLVRECLYKLEVYGFAIDEAGNMFVSTVIGTLEEPRGMVCRLPVDGAPRCFQTEPKQTLGALVALGPNTIVAAMGDTLVRLDLP